MFESRISRTAGSLLLALLLSGAVSSGASAQQDRQDRKMQALREGRADLAIPLFDRARDRFREAARLDRTDPEPRIWLARTEFLRRGGDLDRAVVELDATLRLDASNLEARYWKARTLHRRGKGRDLEQSRDLYAGIVSDRPLFRDAVRRLQETHVVLGTLPSYVAERETEARASRGAPLETYRWAEALRQSGELARAEALFRGIRESHRDFAPGRVLYSLALTLFEQDRWDEGTTAYQDAVTYMEDHTVADTMWEDIFYIADLSEAQRFRQAETVEAKRDFLRGFWRRRDPDRTSIENETVATHYKRLEIASREYLIGGIRRTWNDPDKMGLLRLPPTYTVDAPFTDMGLIYIRHGEPDERSFSHDSDIDNMTWTYEAKGNRQRMICIFEQHDLGGGWRLVPVPDPSYVDALVGMDPKFGAIRQNPGDIQVIMRLAEEGNRDVREALTTDSHIPESLAEAVPLTLFTDVGTFKGTTDRTRVELYWQFPLAELINEQVVRDQATQVRASISVFSQDLQSEVYRNQRTETLRIPRGTPPNAFAFDQEVIPIPPGIYQLTLKVEDLVGNKIQIQNLADLPVPGYPSDQLTMSTVEIASLIREGESGRFTKPGYTVVPLPTHIYLTGQSVGIYFGIYGLAKDDVNATNYQISYTLEAVAGEGGGALGRISIGGLLGNRNQRGGITVTQPPESGIFSDVHKVLNIDLAGSTYSQYRLRVRVHDLVSDETVENVTFFRVLRGR